MKKYLLRDCKINQMVCSDGIELNWNWTEWSGAEWKGVMYIERIERTKRGKQKNANGNELNENVYMSETSAVWPEILNS